MDSSPRIMIFQPTIAAVADTGKRDICTPYSACACPTGFINPVSIAQLHVGFGEACPLEAVSENTQRDLWATQATGKSRKLSSK